MELNILLRGQSNAMLMGEYSGGAQAMVAKVEALLGFDGVNDKVRLEYSSTGDSGNTAYSGTSFLKEWLSAKGGDWHNGWTVAELEQGLLNFVNALPAAQKAEPTAVVWLHSEYDSGNSALTPDEFASAVRFDAALLRQAFGQSAASLPYLFVSAIPYSEGTGQGHQAIRTAMEELAADPAFNARIAARALDTDMNWQDVTGDGKVDFGGPHQSDADSQQTADRIAFSLAQTWAQYAKAGSPVAQANGVIDDLGPQVVQASLVGTNQLSLKVGFDAAHSLAALDGAAAAGVGWTVIGSGGVGTAVDATSARLTGTDTLLVTFGDTLPAGGKLYYGWGYGRLAATNGSGEGHAVYDDEGMPIWVDAHGLAINGVATTPAVSTLTSGNALPPAQFGTVANGWSQAGLAWSGTLDYAHSLYQTFGGRAAWGALGGVNFAPATWDPNWSTKLAFDNFPDANLDLHAAGARPLEVLLVAARGGSVVLGDGSDHFTWVAHTDTAGSGNTLLVQTGGGNDVLTITSTGLSGLADYDLTGNGARYNPDYDGHNSLAELHLGGAATVTTAGATKLLVYGDGGADTVSGGSQGDIFLIGGGGGSFTGGGGGDTWLFVAGSGHTVIQDFTHGQDWLTFAGLTAANLTIASATEGGVSGTSVTFDAAGHSVFLAGVAALSPGDIMFA